MFDKFELVKKVFPILKNKTFLSSLFVVVYILILHDTDIFAIQAKHNRVAELHNQIELKQNEIADLKVALNEMDDPRTLEKYAREEHYFKKADEDLFIFSFE